MKKAQQADFPRFEAEMLELWDKEKTFEASLELRKDAKRFSFYDGPPFANGLPHYGHALASAEKDAITRYKTMRGYFVPRRAGWDTHGLPVEYEVEKQLGLSGKQQILAMGIDKFNEACRASVFKYKNEWEQFFRRFGRWIDTEHAYATLDDTYIESVWWVFASIYKKGLVYEDFRSNAYCPRCATPLSNFELNQGYQDGVEDPSVYAYFPLADDPGTKLVAWTTTPWTLPANAALAVDETADYVTVELKDDGDSWKTGDKLVLAKDRLSVLDLRKAEYKVIESRKGSELVGLRYEPLYEFGAMTDAERKAVWQVYADESVSLEDGSGILHVAPRYGETDLALGKAKGLPLIESVNSNGRMVDEFKKVDGLEDIADVFFKEADPMIIADLTRHGKLFAAETFTHTYPFCWRCDTPLLYFALPTWYIKVSSLRKQLVANNDQINWVPGHIKEGRFGNWLAEARDWNFSRSRFWGAPVPIWRCGEGHLTVFSSIDELRSAAIDMPADLDMHRPGIDAIRVKCADCEGEAKRIEEVFDCWFESGSMPYAQDHYPFEEEKGFDDRFPAEFIAEGLDQTRGWFYTLHVLATALYDKPSFKNVIVNGIVVAADGKKLSKRLKNYPDPQELFDKYGVDSLRFFLSSSPAVAGEDVRFSDEAVGEVFRNVFMTLWNVHSFFTTYAEIDGWEPSKNLVQPASDNLLDQWLLARVNQTIAEVTEQADNYYINRATRPLRDLVEDLSNWYVRRSRRRFWKSEDDGDKANAYATLHYALVRISQLFAPWSPFVSDRLWRELTAGMDVPASVHLSDWPEAAKVDAELIAQMALARTAVTEGLSKRAEAGIKVRQPLSKLTFGSKSPLPADLVTIIAEEVNVKSAEQTDTEGIELDTEITPELAAEGMMRDVVRHIQNARKQEGLAVDDRIKLHLTAEDPELHSAITTFKDLIAKETLATSMEVSDAHDGSHVPVKVSGHTMTISLTKAS